MSIGVQIAWLFLLAIPIACVTWTVTHEEIFREPREYCINRSKNGKTILERKFFYLFTCEYCFSHYVTILFLFLTNYQLIMVGWRGNIIAGFSLVWIVNLYLSLMGFLKQDIKKEKLEIEVLENSTNNIFLKTNKMDKNEALQEAVKKAINWEPSLKAAHIQVVASEGAITLYGNVETYLDKVEAVNYTKSIIGVKKIVNNIEIKLPDNFQKTDAEIAEEAESILFYSRSLEIKNLKVTSLNGNLTLTGEVFWNYQKEAAAHLVSAILGVKGVKNNIDLKIETHDEIEKNEIEKAFHNNWALHKNTIDITVLGSKVTLNGEVHSIFQSDEAERIAWKAPGVISVENELIVDFII